MLVLLSSTLVCIIFFCLLCCFVYRANKVYLMRIAADKCWASVIPTNTAANYCWTQLEKEEWTAGNMKTKSIKLNSCGRRCSYICREVHIRVRRTQWQRGHMYTAQVRHCFDAEVQIRIKYVKSKQTLISASLTTIFYSTCFLRCVHAASKSFLIYSLNLCAHLKTAGNTLTNMV